MPPNVFQQTIDRLRQPILSQLNAIREQFYEGRSGSMLERTRPNAHAVFTEFERMLLGQLSPQEAAVMQQWENIRTELWGKLKDWETRFKGDAIHERWIRNTTRWLRTPLEQMGYHRVQNMVVNYLTASTLGLNLPSTVLNMMQTPTTTLSSIGLYGTWKGMVESYNRAKQYINLRLKGIDTEKAADLAFGEYMRYFNIDPKMFNLAITGKEEIDVLAAHDKALRTLHKFTNALLLPFTFAEKMNHMIAFYGTRALYNNSKYLKEINPELLKAPPQLVRDVADYAAFRTVGNTQFVPTPGGATLMTRKLLGIPVLRQFTSFPIRFSNWLWDSFYRSSIQRDRALFGDKYNPGTMLRLLTTGTVLNRFFQDILGVDVSRGLGADIVPNPPDDMPFSPLPLPPAPSIILMSAKAVATGDTTPLKKVAPLLVPGGVAMSRVLRMTYQVQNGNYYDDKGRLISSITPGEQFKRMLFGHTVQSNREYTHIQQTNYHRNKIRDYRTRFAIAAARADTRTMAELQQKWQEEYPQLPPLQISEKDLRRGQTYMLENRIQRQLHYVGPLVKGVMDTSVLSLLNDQVQQRQQQLTPSSPLPVSVQMASPPVMGGLPIYSPSS